MLITTLVMLVAFAAVYLTTYSNTRSENQKKLSDLSEEHVTISQSADSTAPSPPSVGGETTQILSSNYTLSFNIEVDMSGKVLNIDSFIDMPEEVYYNAAATAWSNQKNISPITLEGRKWIYAVTRTSVGIVGPNGQQSTVLEDSYQISFLDVTDSYQTLWNLLMTFLIVGLAVLVAIFFISLYFANRAIKPIAAAWDRQRQFVTDASHELKTPLSIINANLDALNLNPDETIASQKKWLDSVKIGSDRMAKLINELLSLAKMEDKNSAVHKTSFDVGDAIREVMSSMEASVREKGIKLSQLVAPDIIAHSDVELIKQVFTILYDNAIKYTEADGQIEVSLRKNRRHMICSIKNSGKGIAKQDLPKIFDRFYRADPSRTGGNGGYGLGLSIARTIVDRLGGEIHAESEENVSTTFLFTLPL